MTDNLYKKLSEERKIQQDKGLLPLWYSTGGWQLFKSRYLYGTDSYKGQITRIAKTAAKHTPDPEYWEPKFFEMIWNGWFSCSTPVLANMGTDRGLPVSCSGCYVPDSVAGFYDTATEIAVLSQHAFGTSAYLGDIRPRGSAISGGGKASGIMPVMKNLVQVCKDISQGGIRRGSGGWYLPITHGDFWEVLHYLESTPDDLNIGWNIHDDFVEALNSGDEEAISRYQSALKVKMATGKGYFCFMDKANRGRPQCYVDLGLELKASQLCTEIFLHSSPEYTYTCQPEFASVYLPDGTITTLGSVSVGDKIWSSEGGTTIVGKVSSGVKPVYSYKTSAGVFIGTEDHRVLQDGEKVEVKYADKIDRGWAIHNTTPLQEDTEAVLAGLLVGDGTYRNGKNQLCVGKADQDYYAASVGQLIQENGYSYFRDCVGVLDFTLPLTTDRYVPENILRGTASVKSSFLKGLYSANGSVRPVTKGNKVTGVILKQSSEKLVRQVQEMLFSLGIESKIHKQVGKVTKFSNGEYLCKDSYHLGIYSCVDVAHFRDKIGFIQGYKNKAIIVPEGVVSKKRSSFDIISVDYLGEFEVFHIEVDNATHTYNTGGLNVSNCVLGSMIAATYDEWRDTDAAFTATVFLDCVASEFIAKAQGIKHLSKAVSFTEHSRALGLGQMGLFSLFQKRRIDPESFEAHMLNNEVAKHLEEQSLEASKWMARELGECKWTEGYGVRNTHLRAIAPTKSTALLSGGWSEGINPDPAMAFSSSGAAGDIDRVNPVLLELIKEKGLDVNACTSDLLAARGSAQGVAWLTPEEKTWFKTAFEIDQHTLVRYASQRQRRLDQGQSTNLFFAHDDTESYISEVHQAAFEDENIWSLYYVYSSSEISAERTGECVACE